VLLGADLYEFSWRYQLPALVTLPVAGAFGVTALVGFFRARARAQAQAQPSRVAAMAGGATEAAGAVEAVEPVGAMISGKPAAGGSAHGGSTAGGLAASDVAAEVGDTADELAVAGSEQAAP
jgi:hypothetical protein